MGTKPWKGAHFGGAVKPVINDCEEVQECPLPEIELALNVVDSTCKSNDRNATFDMKNIGPNNILVGTKFNLEWTGVPEGASIDVSSDFTISNDYTEITAANLVIVSDDKYARNFSFKVAIADIGCVAPFGVITCTITTDDYTLLNEGNQFVITYTP